MSSTHIAESSERRIHVVFLAITFHPEPGALRGLPLARRLVASGRFDVTVITAIPWYPLGRYYPGYRLRAWQWEEIDGVRILRVPIYPSHDGSAARRILTYVSYAVSALVLTLPLVRRADVVYHVDNLPTTGLVSCVLRRVWRGKLVQHIGDLWPDSVLASGMVTGGVARIVKSVVDRVQRFVYARNDAITVITEGFRDTLVARGVAAAKIVVLPNWADESQFSPAPRDERLENELGLTGKFNIVYAGNIGPLQALEVVVDAARRLLDLEDMQFVIIGDGPSLPRLRAAVEERCLPNVRLVGRVPQERMARVNAAADVMLIHLKDEPFLHATVPSKTQISLLSGKPVLLGARGDAAQLIEAAGAGLVFCPEDGQSLAEAARRLHDTPRSLLARMGENGAKYYHEQLSLSHGTTVMHRLFESTVLAPGLA